MKRSPVIQVTAAIIIHENTILITQRHRDDEMGGKWEFPGGKIEQDETPEACLQRELYEELDILVDVDELYCLSKHAYPTFAIELMTYRASIRCGQISLNIHQDYRWVPLQELDTFDFLEADKPIVQKLMDGKDFI